MKLRITGGRVLDPATGLDVVGDILVDDGTIVSIPGEDMDFTADQTIDASNRVVIPGIVDLGARFREPGLEYKASIASEARAAARGGVTSVCYPPDTIPVIDTTAVVELIHQRIKTNAVRIFPLAAITAGLAGERLAEMHTLMKAGCIGVSNGNRPMQNTEVLRRAMEYAASFDITVHLQPEDIYLRNEGVAHEGATSTRLGLPPIPAVAETVAVAQALLLVEQTGVRLHLCRLSSARSVELLAQARKDGLPVTADTGICHLYLCDTDINAYDTNRHLIPPLRSMHDRQVLREAVASGIIDAVCSDHQPHDDDAKVMPFSESEPGASTIESLLPLLYGLVEEEVLPLDRAVAALTSNPARIMGIEHGTLARGKAADITVFDPAAELHIQTNSMCSSGNNTPFHDFKLPGQVSHTLMQGRIIYPYAE